MESQPALRPVLNRLREYRKAADLSYSALAKLAGLSRAALLGMDAKGWGPTSATILAIEALIPADWQPGTPLPDTKRPVRRKAA